jgi:hypothetical protein
MSIKWEIVIVLFLVAVFGLIAVQEIWGEHNYDWSIEGDINRIEYKDAGDKHIFTVFDTAGVTHHILPKGLMQIGFIVAMKGDKAAADTSRFFFYDQVSNTMMRITVDHNELVGYLDTVKADSLYWVLECKNVPFTELLDSTISLQLDWYAPMP